MDMTTSHPLIAVVEDDMAVRCSLQFALEAEGYGVCAFADAAQALGSADIGQADCLVIDYGLPGMDGLALMEALRGRAIACPAIIIAGTPSVRCRRQAAAAGAALLEKPLMGAALSRQIDAALAG